MSELAELLPQTRLELAETQTGDVTLVDRGTSFSVSVGGERRRFDDEKRDCSERARNAAVFVALVLDPLRVPEPPKPKPAAEPERPAPEAAPAPMALPAASHLDFELGPVLWIGLGAPSQNIPLAGGVGARLRWGKTLGLAIGGGAFLPSSLHYERADVRALWVPADLSLFFRQRRQAWELGAELGAMAAFLSLVGERVERAERQNRIELGGRFGVWLRYWATPQSALFLSAHGAFFPRPYLLDVEGLGEIGQTPALWMGTSLGVVIGSK